MSRAVCGETIGKFVDVFHDEQIGNALDDPSILFVRFIVELTIKERFPDCSKANEDAAMQ
jgi:p-aminobenzoyl-glutamate transporter AbgT